MRTSTNPTVLRRVCVFCGSSSGARPEYAGAARGLGRLLAARGIGVVYGGASVGTMGALADAALEAGGSVEGVIPRVLVDREVAHRGLSELHVVGSMHERKARMAELADAFVTLPGGVGTMEEFFEVWTWGMLGIHGKPFGLLDVAGYFRPLTALLDHMVTEGFLPERHRGRVLVDTDAATLLDRMARFDAPAPPRILDPSET